MVFVCLMSLNSFFYYDQFGKKYIIYNIMFDYYASYILLYKQNCLLLICTIAMPDNFWLIKKLQ